MDVLKETYHNEEYQNHHVSSFLHSVVLALPASQLVRFSVFLRSIMVGDKNLEVINLGRNTKT